MTGLEGMDPRVRRQYESLWGTYAQQGEFSIGDRVKVPGASGEVIWRFKKDDGRLYYVIGSSGQWPIEVAANEVQL